MQKYTATEQKELKRVEAAESVESDGCEHRSIWALNSHSEILSERV